MASLPSKQDVPETDEDLLHAYVKGDRSAFTTLVQRYERELFHFLSRFLGDRSAAEDMFQEAFLQVHQSAAQFDPGRRFRPWLFTIAANKARDYLRVQSRKHTSPLEAAINRTDEDGGHFVDLMQASDSLPGMELEKSELQSLVHKTVQELPVNLREIVLLAYFHQFPYKQISEMLQVPLGTVKSRLHAAIADFAHRWRQIPQNRKA
jgi:RNA polymerase sigma-70 factor, ECF subfamily